jgi:nitrate/nitrite transporter NarK
MNFSRVANWMFGFGLLGWAVFTFITPVIIKVLFTPPVSFGTNCEPAAAWSMNKLISTQIFGIIVFMILGIIVHFYMKKRSEKKDQEIRSSAK